MKEYAIKCCICFTLSGLLMVVEKLLPNIGVSMPFLAGWLCSIVWYYKEKE